MKSLVFAAVVVSAGCIWGQTAKHPKPECEPDYQMIVCGSGCEMLVCRNGKIVVDEEESQRMEEEASKIERARANLAHALVTRVLTTKEMAQVLERGYELFVERGRSFRDEDKRKEYQAALEIQKTLREMETKPCKP